MDAILLDTHAFLWWCAGSSELSRSAKSAIAGRPCLVSIASMWEMAIKLSLEKLKLPAKFESFITDQMHANAFTGLDISLRHIAECARLPWRHRDPFDRLLAAQALTEGLAIVSRDAVFHQYGVERIW